jgi:integrase/recombinase XerD
VIQPVKEPFFLPGSVLTHEQMRRLLDMVSTDTPDGYRLRTMLEVLYSSGMRIAELLGLDLGDVDFANATAKVLGKGRKERLVPVGRTALQYLQGYIRAVRPLLVGVSGEGAIFVNSLSPVVRDRTAAGWGQYVSRQGTARTRVAGYSQTLRQTHDQRPQEGTSAVSPAGA